jgi:low affinity Fe/Cu permease
MAKQGVEAFFSRLAHITAHHIGRSYSFFIAIAITIVWGALGPVFGFSDTWQLVINTGTTIITWWMVFLLQNTQNRDTLELKLKLDELIRAADHAKNRMIALEELSEDELQRLKQRFDKIAIQ